jgi:hypothetical protein
VAHVALLAGIRILVLILVFTLVITTLVLIFVLIVILIIIVCLCRHRPDRRCTVRARPPRQTHGGIASRRTEGVHSNQWPHGLCLARRTSFDTFCFVVICIFFCLLIFVIFIFVIIWFCLIVITTCLIIIVVYFGRQRCGRHGRIAGERGRSELGIVSAAARTAPRTD